MNFESEVIHGKQQMINGKNVMIPPIIMDSATALESVDYGINLLSLEKENGFFYSRYGNPTVRILEEKMALLEDAQDALACSSGMTAVWLVVMSLCRAGDNVILPYNVYHEISDFMTYLHKFNISVSLIDMSNVDEIEKNIKCNTRLILIETPTNPMLKILDIRKIAKIAKKHNVVFAVDNTMLTNYIQKPIRLGADISLYSTTKFINGHGDAIGGVICGSKDMIKEIKVLSDFAGTMMTPYNAWLTLRGLKTLHVRMDRQVQNAQKLAEFLQKSKFVEKVFYPGLEDFEQARLVNEQMRSGGAIITFEIKGGKKAGEAFMRNMSMIKIATTFGNIETIAYHFATFARPSRDIEKIGESLGAIRCSVGLENIEDIIKDFKTAFGNL